MIVPYTYHHRLRDLKNVLTRRRAGIEIEKDEAEEGWTCTNATVFAVFAVQCLSVRRPPVRPLFLLPRCIVLLPQPLMCVDISEERCVEVKPPAAEAQPPVIACLHSL